ncbi:unnamed protein product, partial [Discosporangium mesarthrocarpum]
RNRCPDGLVFTLGTGETLGCQRCYWQILREERREPWPIVLLSLSPIYFGVSLLALPHAGKDRQPVALLISVGLSRRCNSSSLLTLHPAHPIILPLLPPSATPGLPRP